MPLDSRAIYVLLLIYGASATTTIVPLLEIIVKAPLSGSNRTDVPLITPSQQQSVLASYGSFFFICLFLTLDMANRLVGLVGAGQNTDGKVKIE